MARVESINAVTLHAVDMAASMEFYKGLGFTVTFGGETASFTTMSSGDCHVNLTTEGVTCSWGRVIFHVDDVDGLYERAVAAGLQPDASPSDAPWAERYFPIHDPSGHDLSFAKRL